MGKGSSPAPQPKQAPPEPAGAPAADQNIKQPVIQNRHEGDPASQPHLLGPSDDGASLLSPKKKVNTC